MNKKLLSLVVGASMVMSLALASCGEKKTEPSTTPAATTSQVESSASDMSKATEASKATEPSKAEAPGESGFNEIPIGKEQVVGPFNVAAVYFQSVDMIPEGRMPAAAESDMHLETDIHLTPEAGKAYGFGDGEDIWPAYLNVSYKVLTADGKPLSPAVEGVLMPMNADDGAHYGANIKKGLLKVGKYKLEVTIKPSQDYFLHVDEETGVPVSRGGNKAKAEKYYEAHTVTFDWDYTAKQMKNK